MKFALAGCFMFGVAAGYALRGGIEQRDRLHAIEAVTIVEGPILFHARIDTGAAITSINARDLNVVNGDTVDLRNNIGKTLSFTLDNGEGKIAALTAPIVDVKSVRTGDCQEWRYHIYLTIEHDGTSRRTLVNLNDRSRAREKMLLGRNWLEQGYVVDMAIGS